MFIYCFYRHVNHLNGNYVMKISGGESSLRGEWVRMIELIFSSPARKKGPGTVGGGAKSKPRRQSREERQSVLNFQRHVITCKFIAFHSETGGDHACLSSFFAMKAFHGGERAKMEIYLREKRHLIPSRTRWAEK
jgi:hypothetical protein